jgi:hypothetical protein
MYKERFDKEVFNISKDDLLPLLGYPETEKWDIEEVESKGYSNRYNFFIFHLIKRKEDA